MKYTNDNELHDISFVDSIQHMRHALALNEDRGYMTPEIVDLDSSKMSSQESFVQAWFLGAHADLGGAALHDGLSLYPLQWMLIESLRCGLVLAFEPRNYTTGIIDDPLKLVFPTTWPFNESHSNEDVWLIRLQNGFTVEMHDLRSTLRGKDLPGSTKESERSHKPRLNYNNSSMKYPRKIFDNNGLRGWRHEGLLLALLYIIKEISADERQAISGPSFILLYSWSWI